MDREKLGEVISAGLANAEVVEAEHLLPVFSDEELLAEVAKRQLTTGSLALEGAIAPSTPEAPTVTAESLLATFDGAYQSYGLLVSAANSTRAEAKGRKKPAPLETVAANTILADVEALLSDPYTLQELQAEIDHFTKNPETGSPEAGFNLIIVPEGLTAADEQAAAQVIQTKIPSRYKEPYIRPASYNDQRTPAVTGKGYRIAFAPTHYNVPSGTAAWQAGWMRTENDHGIHVDATKLQTATDGEALAAINNLVDNKELNNPTTRFDQTYFSRFDQAPIDRNVSNVCVPAVVKLCLGRSLVGDDFSTRALVVPKA
jgi:hypothetical protein